MKLVIKMFPIARISRYFASTAATVPKITTHYTVVPRETDPRWKDVNMERVADQFDVVIVGGGPSGFSTAIKLKQLNADLRVCLVEKASEIGGHILSGAVIETKAMDELFPKWKEMNTPIHQPVTKERVAFLTEKRSIPLPLFPGTELTSAAAFRSQVNSYKLLCQREKRYLKLRT